MWFVGTTMWMKAVEGVLGDAAPNRSTSAVGQLKQSHERSMGFHVSFMDLRAGHQIMFDLTK